MASLVNQSFFVSPDHSGAQPWLDDKYIRKHKGILSRHSTILFQFMTGRRETTGDRNLSYYVSSQNLIIVPTKQTKYRKSPKNSLLVFSRLEWIFRDSKDQERIFSSTRDLSCCLVWEGYVDSNQGVLLSEINFGFSLSGSFFTCELARADFWFSVSGNPSETNFWFYYLVTFAYGESPETTFLDLLHQRPPYRSLASSRLKNVFLELKKNFHSEFFIPSFKKKFPL